MVMLTMSFDTVSEIIELDERDENISTQQVRSVSHDFTTCSRRT